MTVITEITSMDQFNTLAASDKLTVVDFYADWCEPCKAFAPIYDSWAERYPEIQWGKSNVDEYGPVADAHEIQSMPTFVFYKEGVKLQLILDADIKLLRKVIREHSGIDIRSRK